MEKIKVVNIVKVLMGFDEKQDKEISEPPKKKKKKKKKSKINPERKRIIRRVNKKIIRKEPDAE